jgi:hypothetical protein
MSKDESMSRQGDDTQEIESVRDGADVDLSEDPFADDLSEQLEAKAPRQVATRTTVMLFALFLAVGGFLAGAQVQKHWGQSTAATADTTGGANQFAGGARPGASGFPGLGGGQAQSGQSGGGTTGTVKLVDGDTVYIVTADGSTVIVKTNGSTSVQTSQAGSLKDLTAGATVTVQGQAGTDGSVTATKITKTK